MKESITIASQILNESKQILNESPDVNIDPNIDKKLFKAIGELLVKEYNIPASDVRRLKKLTLKNGVLKSHTKFNLTNNTNRTLLKHVFKKVEVDVWMSVTTNPNNVREYDGANGGITIQYSYRLAKGRDWTVNRMKIPFKWNLDSRGKISFPMKHSYFLSQL